MTPAWLTLPEFMSASGRSRSAIFRDQRLSLIQTRKDGRTLLISYDSLPKLAREKLEALSAPPKELRPATPSPQASASLFTGIATETPGRRILLDPEQERQATRRLAILTPLLDFCSDKTSRARYSLLRLRSGRQVSKADDLADYLVETHSTEDQPLSRPTLWRWKQRFEKEGLPGLARKIRADKGRSTWAELYPAAAELVAATWLQPFRSKQLTYDALRSSGIIPSHLLPSYQSVCLWLENIPKAAQVLAREGERAHNERMAPFLSRGYTDLQPNEVWTADTMLHDVLVSNDCFGANPDFAAIRPQLTCIMDMRSRKVVGYAFVLDGSSRSITTALRMAVQRYGPPATFYCDNGRDFQKVGRGAAPTNSEAKAEYEAFQKSGALRQLGISVQFCIPYHPQSKPIERFFGTLHGRFDKQFPHYTGGNSTQRPDGTIVAATNHGKVLRMGAPEQSPLLPASHFIRMASVWIEEDYNARHKHSGKGMNGRTPDEVFAPALELQRPFDPGVLDTLLWSREKRTVLNCAVTVAGQRLIGTSAYATETLYRANESEVIVCFDPNAPQFAVITDLSGHKLCEVKAETFALHSTLANPMIGRSIRQKRTLRNNTAQSIREIRKRTTVMGHKPALHGLSDRALQLPADTTSIVHPVEQHSTVIIPTEHYQSEDIGDMLAGLMQRSANGA